MVTYPYDDYAPPARSFEWFDWLEDDLDYADPNRGRSGNIIHFLALQRFIRKLRSWGVMIDTIRAEQRQIVPLGTRRNQPDIQAVNPINRRRINIEIARKGGKKSRRQIMDQWRRIIQNAPTAYNVLLIIHSQTGRTRTVEKRIYNPFTRRVTTIRNQPLQRQDVGL